MSSPLADLNAGGSKLKKPSALEQLSLPYLSYIIRYQAQFRDVHDVACGFIDLISSSIGAKAVFYRGDCLGCSRLVLSFHSEDQGS